MDFQVIGPVLSFFSVSGGVILEKCYLRDHEILIIIMALIG